MKSHIIRLSVALMALSVLPGLAQEERSEWPVGFGLDDRIGLGITLAKAEPIIATQAPSIGPPTTAATGESVRIMGPYRWKDCLLDISFYFQGSGPESERKLQTVLLQTVNDRQSLCYAEMTEELDFNGSGHLSTDLVTPEEGRSYVSGSYGEKAWLVWLKSSPGLKLFASSATIDPRQSTPMVRIDAIPIPSGVVTLSQTASGYDRNPPDISFALAKEAAETALAACRQDRRAAVAVEVLGPRGGLKILLSDEKNDPGDYIDGSAVLYDRLRTRAYTVLQTQQPSRNYTDKLLPTNGGTTNGFLHSKPLSADDLAGGPGALPIWRGDVLAGVISVDGAVDAGMRDDYNKDEACAQAGIDKIKARLTPLQKSLGR